MRARGRSFTACATTRVNRARLSAQMIDCYAITGEMSMEGKSRQPETAAVRGGCVCSGVGTGQVVAQVVNGLPTIQRPSGRVLQISEQGEQAVVEAVFLRRLGGMCRHRGKRGCGGVGQGRFVAARARQRGAQSTYGGG